MAEQNAELDTRPRLSAMFWLVLVCIFLIGVAIALMVWVPGLQHRRALEEIADMGGRVYAESSRGPRLIDRLNGTHRRIIAIDLTASRLNDERLDVLLKFPSLQSLSLSGPDLTDDGIVRLGELSKLRRLVLVNCPHVTGSARQELQRAIPGLQVSLRGPALLGVSGRASRFGCRIETVRPGTAAALGGIVVGDRVLSIGGRSVRTFESLAREIARHRPGDVVSVTIFRRGRLRDLSVTLGSWEHAR